MSDTPEGEDLPDVVEPGWVPPDDAEGRVEDAQREVRARLNAIEGLHDEGVISDEEYHQARDITVFGPAGAARRQETAPLPRATPPGGGGLVGAPPGGDEGRGPGGRPPWLIPVVIGVAVLAAIGLALGLWFALSGPSDEDAYADSVSAPLGLLGNSAGVISANLAATSEPADIPALRTSINQQIQAAATASRAITRVTAPGGLREAKQELQSGARNYDLYLRNLLKAASPTPASAPDAISRARAHVSQLKEDFSAALAIAPGLDVGPIVDAGLGSTSGLAQAQRTKAEQIQAERERQLEEQRQSDLARVRTASSFQSPTGNIHCQSFGSSLSCSTDNDAFMVTLPSYGEAYSGEGIVAGGETLPYGASWSGGDGFRCTSAENGITCYNNTGDGFFINRDSVDYF